MSSWLEMPVRPSLTFLDNVRVADKPRPRTKTRFLNLSHPMMRYHDTLASETGSRQRCGWRVQADLAPRWDPFDPLKTFTFVGRGMTPYTNPTFLLFRMATHPLYSLELKTDEKNLRLISVGTGMADDPNFKNNVNMVPITLMHDIQIAQDINCRIAGRCTHCDFNECTVEEWQKAKHTSRDGDLGRAFLDVLGCSKTDPERVQKLDAFDQIESLIQIGLKAGDKIKLEHLASFAPKAVATS